MSNWQKSAYGDFQTPIGLAERVCSLLFNAGIEPTSILEPTCGKGSFLVAALENFPTVRNAVGLEINGEYAAEARKSVGLSLNDANVCIVNDDFFTTEWRPILESLPDPLLVIGNPPWVTNSRSNVFGADNLPTKSNFQNHRGIDAITGKGNFDISEWMLIREIEWLRGRRAVLAVLCKTTTARKVLLHAWKNAHFLESSRIYNFDASKYFGVSVDACLLVVVASDFIQSTHCEVHDLFQSELAVSAFGYRDGRIIADISAYECWKHLEGQEWYKWRSGIKHDCSKVMELHKDGSYFRNGFGELVDLEEEYLFPMLKGSNVAKGEIDKTVLRMLVPQQFVGESTDRIRESAPKTWQYLKSHEGILNRRASSIYRNRPQFSIFGVGEYTFTPWKIAISGLYKKVEFEVIGPSEGRPVVFDDTIYFVACQTREEALYVAELLNSEVAKEFLSAFIFWDSKRPITAEILRRLDLLALDQHLKKEGSLETYLVAQGSTQTNLRLS